MQATIAAVQQRQGAMPTPSAVPSTPLLGPALSPPQDALAALSPGAESGSTAVAVPEAPSEPLTPSQVRSDSHLLLLVILMAVPNTCVSQNM